VEAFLPVGILLVLGLTVCTTIYLLTTWLGPKNPLGNKLSVYECGVPPEGNALVPFQFRYYQVAVLFLLFDVEAAFFFPWALVYRESLAQGVGILVAILLYILFMVVGLIYILRKNALRMN